MDTTEYFHRKMGGLAALLVGGGMAIALIYSAIFPPKPPSLKYADGVYRNRECGTIEFRAGTANFGSTRVTYTLEQQKNGAAALSSHLIGVEHDNAVCRIVYDTSRDGMYVSLGRDSPPKLVSLWDLNQTASYNFTREPDSQQQ